MDPGTMTMLASLGGSLMGGKQLGGMAPPFQSGFGGFQPTGLLGDQSAEATRVIQQGPDVQAPSIEALIGRPETRGQEIQTVPTVEERPEFTAEKPSTGFGGFFGNLDQTLQSPSKVIGMGLLNRIDPRLGAVGLLAGGLLGKNKVF